MTAPEQQIDYSTLMQQAQQQPLSPTIPQSTDIKGEDISHLIPQVRDTTEQYENEEPLSGFKGLLLRYSGFIKSGVLIIVLYWLLNQPFFMSYVYKYIPISYQTGNIFTIILGAILALMFLISDEITPNFVLYLI